MSSTEVHLLSTAELRETYRQRSISPVEVLETLLSRLERMNGALGAYITITPELALAQAHEAERRFAGGHTPRPLEGIPVAIKDLSDYVAGVPNSFGIPMLRSYVPPEDSLHVQRLREAGAVFLGKTNTPELGHKGVTDNRLIGPARNPFDLDHNAGGSSGGAAAAVAAFGAVLAQGSDGGGSIRIPAANCGVFGFKPSFGLVPLVERPNAFGAHAPFCHVGPLARSVADARVMLDVLAGPSGRDPFSLPTTPTGHDHTTITECRIAYSPNLGVFAVDPEVAACVEKAVGGLDDAGAKVERVEFALPLDQRELSDLWIRQASVGNALAIEDFRHAGMDVLDEEDDLPPELLAMIESGRSLTALEHRADDLPRTRVLDAVEDLLEGYDALVCPTLTIPPVRNRPGGRTVGPTNVNGRPVEPCIGWCMTHPFNFTGHPAASLPAGTTSKGLPVGLQLVGRRHADGALLALCESYERARPWMSQLRANLNRLEARIARMR